MATGICPWCGKTVDRFIMFRGDIVGCRYCGIHTKQTNADRIRSMTDERLAVEMYATKTTGRISRTIDFDVHAHQLRHTCVTRWIENGLSVKEVQYLAGHATPDVTMRIYAHYRREQEFGETAARVAEAAGKLAHA